MSKNESYQNDVDRVADRIRLVLNSFTDAPEVDQTLLFQASLALGEGLALLDEAISTDMSSK